MMTGLRVDSSWKNRHVYIFRHVSKLNIALDEWYFENLARLRVVILFRHVSKNLDVDVSIFPSRIDQLFDGK